MRLMGIATIAVVAGIVSAFGQLGGGAGPALEHPAIRYSSSELRDPVARLSAGVEEGSIRLRSAGAFGYLPSILEALGVPVESQLLVFSKTSLQSQLINPGNPRAIYFNDAVAVAWVRGSAMLELAAHDPQHGMIFYTLDQSPGAAPRFVRETSCLSCHHTAATLHIPGVLAQAVLPGATGAVAGRASMGASAAGAAEELPFNMPFNIPGSPIDHRSAYSERWGGWYVTGKRAPLFHLGNAVVSAVRPASPSEEPAAAAREPLPEQFATSGYITPYSDVVALAVFEHQMHMMNLITRVGWESRAALHRDPAGPATVRLLNDLAVEFVDYLLFVDEAPLPSPLEGSSGFAERFAASGPFDGRGRSLRQFDLQERLLRYSCSYMIYSAAFAELPAEAKTAIYERLWEILSGRENGDRYGRFSIAARNDVIEILRATLAGLPEYFRPIIE